MAHNITELGPDGKPKIPISEHFYRYEAACKCGCGYDTPDPLLVRALELLRDTLNEAAGTYRDGKGEEIAINVNSMCRCRKHNTYSGGKQEIPGVINSGSQHLYGKAADIWVEGMEPKELVDYAKEIDLFNFGGIGVYRTFVHVDVRYDGPARWEG